MWALSTIMKSWSDDLTTGFVHGTGPHSYQNINLAPPATYYYWNFKLCISFRSVPQWWLELLTFWTWQFPPLAQKSLSRVSSTNPTEPSGPTRTRIRRKWHRLHILPCAQRLDMVYDFDWLCHICEHGVQLNERCSVERQAVLSQVKQNSESGAWADLAKSLSTM